MSESTNFVVATQSSIAKELGVATSTVQRALAGSTRISLETRQKVQKLVGKYQYRPNIMAKSLKKCRTNTIGVVLQRTMPNHMAIFAALELEADKRGYTVMLAISNMDPKIEEEKVRNLVERGIDAIIMSPENPSNPFFYDLVLRGTPILFYENKGDSLSKIPCVGEDHVAHGQMLTEYLLSLGHTRIAYIDASPYKPEAYRGVAGYKIALRKAGIPVEGRLVFQVSPLTHHVHGKSRYAVFENGVIAARELLSMELKPSAIITEGDAVASGVLNYASNAGIKVPSDLSVANVEGGYLSEHLSPRLTEIAVPHEKMGKILADSIIDQLENPDGVKRVTLLKRGEIEIRESTGPALG